MAKTVVITGASSGIGETTAYELAQEKFNLVLVARNGEKLRTVADECLNRGAHALFIEADVTNYEDLQRVADTAVNHYGQIDVWINNAGTTQLGRFIETSPDDFQRVIETNFFGVVNGTRAALEYFYQQAFGTLINVSSVLGAVPDPYESSYVASKFAIKGFTASIRQEVYLDGMKDIYICTVMPATIDTPIYKNAPNITQKIPLPIPPVYPVALAAETIRKLIYKPKAEVVVGKLGIPLIKMYQLSPVLFEKMFAHYISALHFKKEPTPITKGNLYSQSSHSHATGGWGTVPKNFDKVVTSAASISLLLLATLIKRKRRRKL